MVHTDGGVRRTRIWGGSYIHIHTRGTLAYRVTYMTRSVMKVTRVMLAVLGTFSRRATRGVSRVTVV